MKKLLTAMFVALLMVGCEGDGKLGSDSSESNHTSAATPPESNASSVETPPAKTSEVAKVVVDLDQLEERDDLQYFEGKPFTGVAVRKYPNGQKEYEGTWKDGKRDGPSTSWHENGQKKFKSSYKDGEKDGLTTHWYENGQMSYEGKHKDGKVDGLATMWYKSGQMRLERHLKGGKLISAVVWKPNGEKCPHTNIVDGNGVVVYYNFDHGTESFRQTYKETYKDGEHVKD